MNTNLQKKAFVFNARVILTTYRIKLKISVKEGKMPFCLP